MKGMPRRSTAAPIAALLLLLAGPLNADPIDDELVKIDNYAGAIAALFFAFDLHQWLTLDGLKAGMDRFVVYDKPVAFIGKAAALAERTAGPKRRTRAVVEEPVEVFVVLLWVALVYWTYQDARRRIESPPFVAVCVALSVLIPFLGTVIYLIIRPPEYLDEARERELELLAVVERPIHIPIR